jgi:hypothetical protein
MIVQDFVVPKMLSNLVPFIFVQKTFTLTSILALQGKGDQNFLIPTRHVIDAILLKEDDVPPERRYTCNFIFKEFLTKRAWPRQLVFTIACALFIFFLACDLGYADDVQSLKAGVVKITANVNGQAKVGTGVVIRQEADAVFIATASHVIEGDPKPTVHFYSQPSRLVPATVVGMEGGDPRGLAVLVVREDFPDTLRVLPLNSNLHIESGEPLTVIGFPRRAGAPWAVTEGELVGRKGRDLVFSGAIDEGNSGGPLLKDHQVIGIVTEASPPFAYAAPAVLVQYAFESWGIRFGVRLRSEPATISVAYLKDLVRQKGFHHPFDGSEEGLPGGWMGTFIHSYEASTIKEFSVVVDHATGLMWQQGGSDEHILFGVKQDGPTDYVQRLNQQKAGGFSDWRLPTVEELGSLLESIGENEGLFIDPVFDATQWECGTSDHLIKQANKGGVFVVGPWEVLVDFDTGRIHHRRFGEGNTHKAFVRAVRTILPEE